METTLFRPQAIAARRRAPLGEPFERSPFGLTTFAIASLVIVGLAIFGVTVVEIPRRATVRGYLAPEGGLVRVRAPASATVAAILVSEGDAVEAGQVLARLETQRSTTQFRSVATDEQRDFDALRRELEVQRDLARTTLEADLAALLARAEALALEADQLRRALDTARTRLTHARRRLEALAPLVAARVVPEIQGSQQQDRVDELVIDVLRTEQQFLERTRAITETNAERSARHNQTLTRVAELDAALARLAIEARVAAAQHEALVRAPVAGTVLRLEARTGATLQASQTVATLAPRGAALQAVMLVPARDAGLLALGQEVVVRLDAFPYQRFGTRRAVVARISGSVQLPGESEAPLTSPEAAYEVRAALDAQRIQAYGAEWPLRSDLTFEADIVLERITVIERMLDPLRAFMRRSG